MSWEIKSINFAVFLFVQFMTPNMHNALFEYSRLNVNLFQKKFCFSQNEVRPF